MSVIEEIQIVLFVVSVRKRTPEGEVEERLGLFFNVERP